MSQKLFIATVAALFLMFVCLPAIGNGQTTRVRFAKGATKTELSPSVLKVTKAAALC